MRRAAKLTSKGQITIPHEIRKVLGVRAGDRLLFESGNGSVRVRPMRFESPFAKYRGLGNPRIASGRRGIRRWLRQLRGK